MMTSDRLLGSTTGLIYISVYSLLPGFYFAILSILVGGAPLWIIIVILNKLTTNASTFSIHIFASNKTAMVPFKYSAVCLQASCWKRLSQSAMWLPHLSGQSTRHNTGSISTHTPAALPPAPVDSLRSLHRK